FRSAIGGGFFAFLIARFSMSAFHRSNGTYGMRLQIDWRIHNTRQPYLSAKFAVNTTFSG
ncbi:MAG TPA: hypothetical protein VEW46_05020, partial [Pyrinomonadaceae bacterium]|nr:hypothetical protein [Pyrinomonadaceae bacterium]